MGRGSWMGRKGEENLSTIWGCPYSLLLVLYITATNVSSVKKMHIKSMT